MRLLSHSTFLSISAQFRELEKVSRMDLIFSVFFLSSQLNSINTITSLHFWPISHFSSFLIHQSKLSMTAEPSVKNDIR